MLYMDIYCISEAGTIDQFHSGESQNCLQLATPIVSSIHLKFAAVNSVLNIPALCYSSICMTLLSLHVYPH